MPAERKPGYDMPYYDWSPLPTRPPLKWPNNARVALCVILSMDHYQWKPTNDFLNGGMPGSQPEWAYKAPESPGGVSGGGRPFPDVIGFSVREYGPRVRVNCIMPGPFLTDISKAWDMDAFNARAETSIAMKRGGEADEITAAALYLASDGASYTTGAILRIDGGSR